MPVFMAGWLLTTSTTFAIEAAAVEPTNQVSGAAEPSTEPAIYGEGVRPTEWLSPEEQRQGFHLPPGFDIRLFASEPQIAKPLNMAFDKQRRLWVTHSVEYPYPANETEHARDAVSILQDTDGDGEADQSTTFADGLNIPMGVLPYGDGCLCFSIPNIWYLRDTDGDGKCDRREVVLGPFDTTRDTHGMINSLRDVGDGWIYACHGFNNQSRVAGSDGHVVMLNSGNTFRFRPDGSRIEHYTHGQVNPFGMTVDEWGYLYSADCHSKPITQLVRGACYPSFGRPHDGLGFLPPMVDHLHGSTAISGLLFFPPESSIVPLRGQFISGNVMTSRLNRNKRSFHGATAIGEELPDFLTSDDPWFRPVDIQLGPDGCIYVADFYNKIIGHYEVPLEHPERDRTSGRIWQIRYVGSEIQSDGEISDNELFNHESPLSRLEALRRIGRHAEQRPLGGERLERLRTALSDENVHVVRTAAELLGRFGRPQDIGPLLHRLSVTADDDPVLRQTIRIAIRDLIERAPTDTTLWTEVPSADLASILLGVSRPEASAPLLMYLAAHPDAANRDDLLAHAAKNAGSDLLDECVRVAQKITGDNREKQFELLDVLCESQNARPGNVPKPLRQWAHRLVRGELANIDPSAELLGWTTDDGTAWPREKRTLRGGGEAMLASSLGRGESYTGRLVSNVFPAPDNIVFWIAGHNGFPNEADHGRNRIRLVLAETDEPLYEAMPPRNDTAQRVDWDTSDVFNQKVRIECIDGDSGTAYAWLAIGEFAPAWIDDARRASALAASLDWTRRLGLHENSNALAAMLGSRGLSSHWKTEIAQTMASLRGNPNAVVTLQFLQISGAPDDLLEAAIDATLKDDSSELLEVIKQLCKRLSASSQRDFAIAWATGGAELATLLDLAQRGWISREVLVDPNAAQAIDPRLSDLEKSRLKELTEGLSAIAPNPEVLVRLKNDVASRQGNVENGKALYEKHCAACHQLRGQGAVVGPQLDGATTRSTERLLEDIITPDRNIDQAFRTTSFLLDDARVVVGLVISEDANAVEVVQSNGNKLGFDAQSIELRREAGRSLMPSNLGEILSPQELTDLIHFLQQTK